MRQRRTLLSVELRLLVAVFWIGVGDQLLCSEFLANSIPVFAIMS
jgi:hypothetical protein